MRISDWGSDVCSSDLRIGEAQRAAQPLEMRRHRLDEAVGAALREPDAAVLLQLVDQGVDGAGLHRIAAEQQRVEGERLAALLILQMGGDDRSEERRVGKEGVRTCR